MLLEGMFSKKIVEPCSSLLFSVLAMRWFFLYHMDPATGSKAVISPNYRLALLNFEPKINPSLYKLIDPGILLQ